MKNNDWKDKVLPAVLDQVTSDRTNSSDNEALIPVMIQLNPIESNDPVQEENSQLNYIADLSKHSDKSQKKVVETLKKLEESGQATKYRSFFISNSIAVELTAKGIKKIAKLDEVKEVSSNKSFKGITQIKNQKKNICS